MERCNKEYVRYQFKENVSCKYINKNMKRWNMGIKEYTRLSPMSGMNVGWPNSTNSTHTYKHKQHKL